MSPQRQQPQGRQPMGRVPVPDQQPSRRPALQDLLTQKQTVGDALAVASDWTTPPAAEEPAQASP
ncbi:hypothetical protein PR003_g19779 [Phytophthora rubi]|uniref:Uncharacterized protein n=1 Tax=Phytophthora rubi TaxID=129364 RepID=A0A6A4DWN9_9STRA|nr:hypothetical protein PR002_g23178 [Phytophthora rubi]KAE9312381.1 hypothetical protein PR003_g19779 [Phytophthora rubi]